MSLFAAMDSSVLLTSAILVGVLLLGAVIISVVRRWQHINSRGNMTSNEQLAHFRKLYESGQLSEEEFARLRNLLLEQIRIDSGLPSNELPRDEGNKGS